MTEAAISWRQIDRIEYSAAIGRVVGGRGDGEWWFFPTRTIAEENLGRFPLTDVACSGPYLTAQVAMSDAETRVARIASRRRQLAGGRRP